MPIVETLQCDEDQRGSEPCGRILANRELRSRRADAGRVRAVSHLHRGECDEGRLARREVSVVFEDQVVALLRNAGASRCDGDRETSAIRRLAGAYFESKKNIRAGPRSATASIAGCVTRDFQAG